MNKLTKIGASALCGSLAAISAANAGELSVTGGVDMSWVSLEDEATGNPIGMGSNLTFSGSGELDNGWSVALSVAHANTGGYSNTNVVIGIPGLGDVRVDQGTTGTGIDRLDDKTPNVWEEAWGTGLTTGIELVSGISAGSNIEWTLAEGMLPSGLTGRIAYSPNVGGKNAGDKAGSGVDASALESGYDITLEASDEITGVAGLSVYAGYSDITQDTGYSTISGDREEQTLGATYAMGGLTFGYQWSEEETGASSGTTKYENDMYGITFNINDDLSIGYNNVESTPTGGTATATADSIQLAYTMGGASIRIAEADIDNASYSAAASGDRSATTISVSLAF
jgi:outer membrane protein OmpU